MWQPSQQTLPFVDGEGFPLGTEVRPADGRDKENGELLSTEVMCIRKRPMFRVSPRIQAFLSSNSLRRSHKEGRKFNGFRIQQFTGDNTWEEAYRRSGRPRSLTGPQLQTCVYLEGGTPFYYTQRPIDPHGPSLGVLRKHDYSVREAFRVPRESLPKVPEDQPVRNPNTICVSIWEEFIFGAFVLPSSGKTSRGKESAREAEEERPIMFVHKVLNSLLPKFVVDFLTYFAYFLVFFFSCVSYNMFCELGCYILFAQHLKIHEKANEEKLDVAFTGSLFQGPLYAITRNWCEHCKEREQAQVIMRLMKKMKTDILRPTTTPDASMKDSTQGPS